jgi:2-phospho-L-lactate guanylyltransferase
VTADEIRSVIDSEVKGLTIVPSRDGDGSNAIVFEPLDALTLSFGIGSFARHTAQAAERGIACRTLSFPGIGLDIDSAEDLAELVRRTRGLARYAFLTEPDFSSAGAER